MQKKQKTGLVWFRNDLRVNDNHSLSQAIKENNQVIAAYCFDPRQFAETTYGFKKTAHFRAKFLMETIQELRGNLSKINISLLVVHNTPEEVIPDWVNLYNIDNIYLQKEWTAEETAVTETLKNELKNIAWQESYDQFLFHPEDIPYADFKKIPEVFTEFRKQCEKTVSVRSRATIKVMPESNRIANNTAIPTLQDLGFEDFEISSKTAFPFHGGENQALLRIAEYFWETQKLSVYKKTRNGLIGKDYSSKLSAWLANGSISARTIYWEVKSYEKEIGANEDTYWLIFELIWRDYFKYISLKHGNKIFQLKGILNKTYEWKFNPKAFQQWTNGQTKEPFVNANMIELQQTGWMSNRGRQNVASYWAKEWEQDWRIAAAYFESMLIDYDVHSNYGNWIYNSGVGNDPRDRKFNIKRQAEMYDANGAFQKLWLQTTLL
ncbi:DASH family cryptochrome [Flavobacterium sp. J49]|uniref:DASH family cryptochrome n=1 Tax=Flavobacterium sp. J49 TaxID=2718534 RepID=UPI001593BADC|nr:DASH family cryptochrome [Flavobacterium sp. J49]MBF6641920.1 DASH family cryptochrome [Flavobacterium sp. J49]NIC03167.1 DASH family cryptochrome [Flavobacterium sp. J49]